MDDSDSDDLGGNVFTFRNESTIVSGSGQNVNFNNTGFNFRSNLSSSTNQMAPLLERQRYAELMNGQQSFYNRRQRSPVSARSVCDVRQRNLNYSFNPIGMYAQRSVYNGGAGSAMSVRSIDSSASFRAVDIANALQNEHFSKHDLKVIKQAYNKFVRHKVRNKIQKRRYRKPHRRVNGEDSGEQGSDSSLSSDDRSTNYKGNMSSCRSAITDISNFRRTIQKSNILKDRTLNLKHKLGHNSVGRTVNLDNTQTSITSNRSMIAGSNMNLFRNMQQPVNFNNIRSKEAPPVMLQKDRFTNGFTLPSQRFGKSVISTTIHEQAENENNEFIPQNGAPSIIDRNKAINTDTDSDGDMSIFTNINDRAHRKRGIDDNDILPSQKKQKTVSPYENSREVLKQKASDNIDDADDFEFAKPQFPIRKSVKEKLISKSADPASISVHEAPNNVTNIRQEKLVDREEESIEDEESNITQNSTNVSMKPSFIKRKLFTQKLDVSEKRNLSIDNVNSPEGSIYKKLQKDKHKVRKLQQATTQSCMSHDIQQDGNKLLDLIHKIVPVDKMNITSQTNKTDIQNKNNTEDDKWDVTSIITTNKNDEDVSDTYTDEEILNSTVKELQQKDNKCNENSPKKLSVKNKEKMVKDTFKKPSPVKSKHCKIVLEKLPPRIALKPTNIQSFWDTDLESDAECQPSFRCSSNNSKANLNLKTDTQKTKITEENKNDNNSSRSQRSCRLNSVTNNDSSQSLNPTKRTFWDTDFESDAECQPSSRPGILDSKENQKLNTDTQRKEEPKKDGLLSIFSNQKPITSTIHNFTLNSTQKFNTTSYRIKSHRVPKRNQDRTMDLDATKTAPDIESKKQKTKPPPEAPKQTKVDSKKSKETAVKNNKKSPKAKKITPKSDKPKDTDKITNKINETTNKSNEMAIKPGKVKETPHKSDKRNEKDPKSNCKPNDNTKTQTKKKESKRKKSPQKPQNTKTNDITKNVTTKKQLTKEKKEEEPSIKNPKTKRSTSKNNEKKIIEENNNDSSRNRPVRSCRLASISRNASMNGSDLALNQTMSLRSRKDISGSSKENVKQGNSKKSAARLSDVSFSIPVEKNAVAKRGLKKLNDYLKADESDVSFSLCDNSPTPMKTRAHTAGRNNLAKSMFSKYHDSPVKNIFISNHKTSRNRVPPKKFIS